jgi:hypothetical protein
MQRVTLITVIAVLLSFGSAGCGRVGPSGGRARPTLAAGESGGGADATVTPETSADAAAEAAAEAPPVPASEVLPAGCVPAGGDSGSGAWAAVQPILQRSCVACHTTQAPVFTSRAESEANATAIAASVTAGSMPPAGALSDAEQATIAAWAGGLGAALALADLPAEPTYVGSVRSMVNAKCAWCHSATAKTGVRHQPYLTTYAGVRAAAEAALEEMREGKMPPPNSTPTLVDADVELLAAWASTGYPEGKEAPPIDATQPLGYLDTIKPLLDAACTTCHGPGATPPDLSTYDAAVVGASLALAAVEASRMPPAGSLAADAKAALAAWVAAGTPLQAGDAPLPPPPPPGGDVVAPPACESTP